MAKPKPPDLRPKFQAVVAGSDYTAVVNAAQKALDVRKTAAGGDVSDIKYNSLDPNTFTAKNLAENPQGKGNALSALVPGFSVLGLLGLTRGYTKVLTEEESRKATINSRADAKRFRSYTSFRFRSGVGVVQV